ncbi:LysR family transcriptional regulator [Lactiplantibacillus plantarum EGD-AQ4]|nr:LysR family transcriptional regulator [Lactiplantibacillus plantarum EGD-AQ4]
MNISQLEGFMYTAQTGSITAGAKKAFISQPAMTKLIQDLEKELGTPLFDRVGRGIQINSKGRTFLNYVEATLQQLNQGIDAVSSPISTRQRPIRLLVEVASALIPEIITQIHQIFPAAPVQLTQRISTVNDTENFDFTISTRQPATNLRSVPLLTEEILVGSLEPVFQTSVITPSELASHALVTLGRQTPLRRTMDAYFKSQRVPVDYQYESDDPASIRALLLHGIGIGFIPAITWHATGSQLHLTRLNPNPPLRTIYLTEGQSKETPQNRRLANALVKLFVDTRAKSL